MADVRKRTIPVDGHLVRINQSVLLELQKLRLTIDHLFILECLYNDNTSTLDVYDKGFTMENALFNYQYLERKELIVPDPEDRNYYIISLEGRDLYEKIIDLSNNIDNNNPKIKRSTLFEEWWSTYPATGTWTSEDGRKFTNARSLRSGSKDDNQKLYTRILNEGKYTHEQLIKALKYEIEGKKKQSLLSGTNNLQFMQGSITYLRQRTFENFIGLVDDSSSSANITNYEAI